MLIFGLRAPVAVHPGKTRRSILTTLVLCSGGVDSVTLAYKVAHEQRLDCLLAFDYGQRHRKELDCVTRHAARLGTELLSLDLKGLAALLPGSALTDDVPVPQGHYAEESMRTTVVPNRNAIFLTIACGIAAARGLQRVAVAVHGGDHFIYPDCRPEFLAAYREMQRLALNDLAEIEVYTPFLDLSKAEIVAAGAELAVPFGDTWSCYRGEADHCGRCGTCVERREAFALACAHDPVAYTDPDYWRTAIDTNDQDKHHVSDT